MSTPNYDLLSKHFLQETTAEEEKEIAQYKKESSKEYNMLSSLWKTEGIEVKEFDTKKAWDKITRQTAKPKRRLSYNFLRYAAAIAAIFVLGFMLVNLFQDADSSKLIVVNTNNAKAIKKLELPDGSILYLNKNAEFSYPEKFTDTQRIVKLKGEAFFEIAKDASRPFLVETQHAKVQVLGTSFNINTALKETKVIVATGKVAVQSLFQDKSVVLQPNETALVNQVELLDFPTKEPNYLAWKTGVFNFKEATIEEVLKDLNRYYADQIKLKSEATDCLLTTSFNQNKLSEVLEIIQLSCDLTIKQKGNNYELH